MFEFGNGMPRISCARVEYGRGAEAAGSAGAGAPPQPATIAANASQGSLVMNVLLRKEGLLRPRGTFAHLVVQCGEFAERLRSLSRMARVVHGVARQVPGVVARRSALASLVRDAVVSRSIGFVLGRVRAIVCRQPPVIGGC